MDSTLRAPSIPGLAGRIPQEQRRRQILEAATVIFAEKGFRGTTTREIAAACGVTEALIFRHFRNKHDLYEAILDCKARDPKAAEWVTRLEDLARQGDDRGFLMAIAERFLARLGNDPTLIRVMLHAALERHELAAMIHERHFLPLRRLLRDFFLVRQSEFKHRPMNPDVLVRAFLGMIIHHVLIKTLFGSQAVTIPDREAVNTYLDILLCGILSPDASPHEIPLCSNEGFPPSSPKSPL